MRVEFRNSFLKDLKRLRDRSAKERIKAVIEQIEFVDDLAEIHNVRRLSGGDDFYRVRVGNYRLGLPMDGQVLVFVRCLHRRDIYRYFP